MGFRSAPSADFREAIQAAELDPKWTLGFSSASGFLMPYLAYFLRPFLMDAGVVTLPWLARSR